jgi:glycyl-tRNA synthetase beta chain
MPSLLLEIGCEELPAAACREAALQLAKLCAQHLDVRPSDLYLGPRRLAFVVRELPERSADEWVKGPPEQLRERAAAGFARRHGVTQEELHVRGGFLGVLVPGKPIAEVLPERLAAIVLGLQFGKTMRWGPTFRFARPVRWVCAKLGPETVEVTIDGIPSGGSSYGPRFSAHDRVVEIDSPEAYLDALRAAGVEPDRAQRYRQILEGLDGLGNWSDPHDVLEELVYLVESVRVQEGRFDERFLRLPEQVVITTMQHHQRYFPLGGSRFAFVANGGDPDVVRRNNERVLEARLGDAEFTFERDVGVGIEALAKRSASITYLAGAGSLADKTRRLVTLVGELGGDETALEAARLAKADQAAELVREFPELEGHIGGQYARVAGYSEDVARAIEEHYLPDAARGPLPKTRAGATVAAADKIDNLRVAFELGNRPTGSRDPYGLRRAAIGLCRLALDGLRIERTLLPDDVRAFVEERLESLLKGVPVEFVRAARASSAPDLGGVAHLARTLHDAERSPEFDAVHTAFERAHRLAGKAAQEAAARVEPSLLSEPAERELAAALAEARVEPDGDLGPAAALAPHVNRFFDEVLVMAEDERVRANRLRLLLEVRDTLGRLGDFSQIPR